MKENKVFSYFVVALAYLLATLGGFISYNLLNYHFAINLLIADSIATIIIFIFSIIFSNSSIYDPYWSVQPIIILLGYSFVVPLNIEKILLLIIVLLWGLRLTLNWMYTFSNLTYQDWRYKMLKEKTKRFYPFINFIGIHYVPTLVVYAAILPAVYVFIYSTKFNIFMIIGLMIALLALIIETIADIQMHRYRKNRTTNFIRVGLWKYSRHPNYLGEILFWWGIGLASIFLLNNKLFLLAGALINTLLFIFVSLPMAEKRQSRKEGFLEYKKETRLLFPLKK